MRYLKRNQITVLIQLVIVGLSVSLSLTVRAFCQSDKEPSKEDVPFFSKNAATIYSWPGRRKTAPSPDGKKKVGIKLLDNDNVEDFPAIVTVDTERGQLTTTIRFGLNTEVLWSPDSMAFTLTGSCCGGNGQYQTDVFMVKDNQLVRVSLTVVAERAFGHPVKCGWPEPPNVAAIRWLIPSKRLLVASEIMHHSNCDSFGTFKAYSIDLSERRIVDQYAQLEAKRRFGTDLGEELLQADDNCIREPKSCRVNFNRPIPH